MSAEVAPLAAQRKRRARWAIVVIAVIAVAVVAIVAPTLLKSKKPTTTAPATVTAESRTITQIVSGSGTTKAASSVTVNPEVSGTIEKLYVSLGETVTAGERLYTVSSDDAETALAQAKTSRLQARQSKLQAEQSLSQARSQLYSSKTQLIEAQNNLDRLESQPATSPASSDAIELAKRQVTSAKKGVTTAEKGVSSAKAGVSSAQANYSSAQRTYDEAAADVDKTVVTAPNDGTITSLPMSVGDYVNAGNSSSSGSSGSSGAGSQSGSGSSASSGSSSSSGSSIVIADLSDLAVIVSVSEVDVPDLAIGMEATVTIDAVSTQSFTGEIKSISPNGTSSSGVVTYDVELELTSGDARLRPDMTATADIVTRVATNVVAVPNSAVKSDGTTKYVQVSGTNGSAEKRVVKIGVSDETYTEIAQGLSAGDKVLTAAASGTGTGDGFRGGMMMGGPPGGRSGGN